MKVTTLHYLLIGFCLLVCSFIFWDSFFAPVRTTVETVRDLARGSLSRSRSSTSYSLKTDHTWTTIPASLYWRADYGKDVTIGRSKVSGALVTVRVEDKGYRYTYRLGYVRAGLGRYLLPLVVLGALLLLLFYPRIDNAKGRSNLSIAVFVASLVLLYCHLDVIYLFSIG